MRKIQSSLSEPRIFPTEVLWYSRAHTPWLHTWARLSSPTKTVVCLPCPCPVHRTRWCLVRKEVFHTLLKPVWGFFLSSVGFRLRTPVVFSQLLVKPNYVFSPPNLQFWLLTEGGCCFGRGKKRHTRGMCLCSVNGTPFLRSCACE